MYEEIYSGGYACYHPFQNLPSSHLQAKIIKILMYGIGIVFENRVLRKKIQMI
jgi:hypothetical protein